MEDQPQPPEKNPVGRPRKKGRVQFHAEVPSALVQLLAMDAERNGISRADRLAEILAGYYSNESRMQKEGMQKAS